MQVLESGQVRGLPKASGLGSLSFPAMEVLPSGRWLAGFRAADKKKDGSSMKAMMTWSDDQGKTWVPPFEPLPLPSLEGRPGNSHSLYFLALGESRVLALINWVDGSDPQAPFFDPNTESLKDTRIFYSFSENDGQDWSDPVMIDTQATGGPVPLTGPPMKLADGSLICQFEINKFKEDPKPWIHRSALLFSRGSGFSWSEMSLVTHHPGMFYWDQRPLVLNDGKRLVNFFWTFDGVNNQYKNIHRSESTDGGKSWSQPQDTGVYGQPGHPVQLPDGRLMLVTIDRRSLPELYLHLSRDEGKRFDTSILLTSFERPRQDSQFMKMDEAWEEMARYSVGHPQLLLLENGEILAYFYQGSHPDTTAIHFLRIGMEP
ncbi:sialidase family protein [Cyclobacterium jeungdonense]|uniref:Sialidase family protein n=1 Tax=Cyclobacterium jeungdonense TaxID=708087 RepID=A0ABT8C7N2_9BACT|nr:sialidase family protein [Cyclobacterium jeungdonense]MDN3688780.1 sialidase family protein [Cyclobacterium jeungdonense]